MGRLIENKSVKTKDPSHKVYCQEPYAQELYDRYQAYFEGRTIVPKDMEVGQICKARVDKIDGSTVVVTAESSANIFLDYGKESRFLEKTGHTLKPGLEVDVLLETINRGNYYGSIEKAYMITLKRDLLESMKTEATAYRATIKSINDGGFMVDIAGLDCFMPGSLAAANKVLNFESMLGRELMVMVENYLESSGMFVVSNKKYIQKIIPSKIKELDLGAQFEGTATGTVDYGVFVEWDEIFTGLLHESEITDADWRNTKPGEKVKFYIKEIRENNRIILSQKGPSPEIMALTEFKAKYEGEIVMGEVKDIKQFGAFIEMKNKVTGLLPTKELKKMGRLKVGDDVDVYVKFVDVSARKIHLKADEE